MKKILSLCLACLLAFGHAQAYADAEISVASSSEKAAEVYTFADGSSIKRWMLPSGVVKVVVLDSSGEVVFTLENDAMTDKYGQELLSAERVVVSSSSPYGENWGPWHEGSQTFKTGGMTTAVIAATIAAAAPWVAVRICAAVATTVASKYDSVGIVTKTRYRTEGAKTCYERLTTFYGDGAYISGPHRDGRCSYQ